MAIKYLRQFYLVVFAFLLSFSVFSQKNNFEKIKGSWEGNIVFEGDSFLVVFDVYPDSVSPVLASFPYMASENVKPQSLKFLNDSLSMSLPSLASNLRLVLVQFELKGEWISNTTHDTLDFKMLKTTTPTRIKRPQTPQEPFPYTSEIIQIENSKANVTIEGTLTIPSGKGPFPTVILVTGSGPQDRNSELLMHKSFWVIADYLTRRGIAVFRYDERGVGKSSGRFSDATTFDFADDLLSIFKKLKKHKSIDKNKIGVMGHSEGGAVCAIAASKMESIAFYISLAGPAVSGKDILIEQAKQMFVIAGKDSAFIAFECQFRKTIFDLYLKDDDNKRFAEELKDYFDKTISEIGKDEAKKHSISKSSAQLWVLQLGSLWMKTFIKLDPAVYLEKINCPVLVLIGEKDFQVPYNQNMPVYKSIFQKSANKSVTLLKMESLNHLFQTANTGAFSEYARISETFSPMALNTISEWILKQTQSTPQN